MSNVSGFKDNVFDGLDKSYIGDLDDVLSQTQTIGKSRTIEDDLLSMSRSQAAGGKFETMNKK